RWISFQFRARRSKNYEAYTAYLLNNFCKAVAEIEKKDADLEFRNSKFLRLTEPIITQGRQNLNIYEFPSKKALEAYISFSVDRAESAASAVTTWF
ncbi:MAG: hypothetical protein Q8P52_00155, partial [bacterium]|nr:hypothetical protein [bacterium]